MSLSREQQIQVNELRQQYMDIFTKWSKNPTNFEHNISCLQEMRPWLMSYLHMMMPYIEKAQHKMNDRGFFSGLKTAVKVKKAVKISEAIRDELFNKEMVRAHFKKVFAIEPRIIGLNANVNENHEENIRGNHITSRKDEHRETFMIKFSDGTDITLHSLEDPKALADAKEFFENKLQALAAKPMPAMRMN